MHLRQDQQVSRQETSLVKFERGFTSPICEDRAILINVPFGNHDRPIRLNRIVELQIRNDLLPTLFKVTNVTFQPISHVRMLLRIGPKTGYLFNAPLQPGSSSLAGKTPSPPISIEDSIGTSVIGSTVAGLTTVGWKHLAVRIINVGARADRHLTKRSSHPDTLSPCLSSKSSFSFLRLIGMTT
ncbi:hypothetical protein Salat_2777700 [Sesamum alatum]|uniref:Uncharacterized protein n=1 Tax=Sesamum alatum TaxID=300844 RepID=A0AAE1XL00_9LAMI|nr:hypothetical protein Salat_2777700 [Sesamum alatum]